MEGVRRIDQYNSVKVEKYNDHYNLVLGNENEDKFYPDWRFLSQWDKEKRQGVVRLRDDGSSYCLPTSIVLGDSEKEVKATLTWIYEEIQKMNVPLPKGSEDVPF
jgi:hypothetical protein